jgi:hypothetical protein
MASSLKAYTPTLAWRLGTTAAALYERQRTLVRAGILEQSEGRGPGTGVHITPDSLALLLLAVLATDSLSDTAEKVRIFAEAKSNDANRVCPLTGASCFREAIARVLNPLQPHLQRTIGISTGRTSGLCLIRYYTHKGREEVSKFVAKVTVSADLQVSTRLQVEATVQSDLISSVSADLRNLRSADAHTRGDDSREGASARKRKRR